MESWNYKTEENYQTFLTQLSKPTEVKWRLYLMRVTRDSNLSY